MIKESLDFSYNSQLANTFGITNCHVDSGLYEDELIGEQKILKTTIKNRTKPYFQGIERSPKTLKITAAFLEAWDDDKMDDVINWLFDVDYYVPLIFDELPNRIFYVLPVGSVSLFHNGLKQGYFNLELECNDHYSYSPVYSVEYDLTTNPTTTTIEINNLGHTYCYPNIIVEKSGTGVFQINNLSDANAEFKFDSITDGRTVTIYNEEEIIVSSQAGEYLDDDFNDGFLRLLRGVNELEITGTGVVTFQYQFKYR